MKHIFTSIILFLFTLCANAQIRLVDAADGSPVQAASVFVEGGKCVGASGNDGSLPLSKGYNGTVTVQHINYGNKVFRADTVSGGTVRLTPYIHEIPEVTAKYERPDYVIVQRRRVRLLHTTAPRTGKAQGALNEELAQSPFARKQPIGILQQPDDDKVEEENPS